MTHQMKSRRLQVTFEHAASVITCHSCNNSYVLFAATEISEDIPYVADGAVLVDQCWSKHCPFCGIEVAVSDVEID